VIHVGEEGRGRKVSVWVVFPLGEESECEIRLKANERERGKHVQSVDGVLVELKTEVGEGLEEEGEREREKE